MMYSSAIFKEVNNLKFTEHGFLTIYKNVLCFYDFGNSLIFSKVLLGNSSSSTLFLGNILFIEYFNPKTGFEETFLIDVFEQRNVLSNFNGCLIRSVSNKGLAIAKKYDKEFQGTTALLNFINGSVIWEKPLTYFPFFYNNDLLLSAFNSSIVRYDINGEEMWFFDTIQLGTWIDYDKSEKQIGVSKVIGILNEKIYFYLNSGLILVLATETGDMIQTIVNDKNKDQGSFNGWFMGAIQLDVNNNKLIQLFNQRYTEVDLNTNEVIEILLPQMVEQKLMNFNAFVFDDEYIYFSDQSECKIVAFNRASHLLEWVHSLSDPNTCEIDGSRFGRNLQLHDHRLYVLDNKQTLHVFEKENKAINS